MDASNIDDVPALPRDYTLDCAICLQPFVQPIQLPCSHTFCFLCAKGIALQGQPCALCRADIPVDLLTKPSKFQAKSSPALNDDSNADKHVWYYQGHKGWWQYDERTSAEIEEAYDRKDKSVDILIAGAIYIIDFEAMVQYQRNANSRKRKIKRDTISALKKGVAGMALNEQTPASVQQDSPASSSNCTSTGPRQSPIGDGH